MTERKRKAEDQHENEPVAKRLKMTLYVVVKLEYSSQTGKPGDSSLNIINEPAQLADCKQILKHEAVSLFCTEAGSSDQVLTVQDLESKDSGCFIADTQDGQILYSKSRLKFDIPTASTFIREANISNNVGLDISKDGMSICLSTWDVSEVEDVHVKWSILQVE